MKKLLFLFVFIFCAFSSTQFVAAQEVSESISMHEDLSAEKQAKNVLNLFGRNDNLTKEQSEQILSLYTKFEEKIKNVNGIKDVNQRQQKITKIQTYISKNLQEILTESQYAIYEDKIVKR